jgi:hypothetical protein
MPCRQEAPSACDQFDCAFLTAVGHGHSLLSGGSLRVFAWCVDGGCLLMLCLLFCAIVYHWLVSLGFVSV